MDTVHPTTMSGRPHLDFRAAIYAGVIASLVFQILEMALIPLFGGGSPWGPARMIAAMVLGRDVLPPPATFNLFIVSVALVVDIVQAIIYSIVLALIIRRWSLGAAVFASAVFGVALYVINFYVFTPWLFPWFIMGRHWVTLVTHVVFSVTAAVTYKKLDYQSSRDGRPVLPV